MSLAVSAAEKEEGKEVEVGVKAIEKIRCFLTIFPSLYPPAPHFWIFVLNFAIHHGNSTVSAFISNSTAVHGTPLVSHRPPIPMYLRILG